MTVTLIPATDADIPRLLNLLHTAYAEYRGKLDPPSGAHSETLETVGKKLKTAHVIKAVIDKTPVGCVLSSVSQTAFTLASWPFCQPTVAKVLGGKW